METLQPEIMFRYIISLLLLVTTCSLTSAQNAGIGQGEDFDALVFLEQAGYLDDLDGARTFYHAPDNVKQALKEFQQYTGLPQTGHLDKATVRMMKQPRCGMPDVIKPSLREKQLKRPKDTNAPSEFRLYGSHSKFMKSDLTYKIHTYTNDLPQDQQREAIISAFKRWSDVTPLTFTETSGVADLNLKFAIRIHGDGLRFDWKSGTLAHAFHAGWKKMYGRDLDGQVHFDDDEDWTISTNASYGPNLHMVATHEIGHALGLDHSDTFGAVMFANHKNKANFALDYDDILAIQSLYGPPGGFSTTTSTTPRPSPYCNFKFDDITLDSYGGVYAFVGEQNMYLVNTNGLLPRVEFVRLYKGAPSSPGAIVFNRVTRKMYFFKGTQYWRFTVYTLDSGYPKNLPSDFNNIDAAMQLDDKRIYVFQGSKVAQWDENMMSYAARYPKTISSFFQNGPPAVDAAFHAPNGHLYLFHEKLYWRYKTPSVLEPGFPKDMRPYWLTCGRKGPEDDEKLFVSGK